jgi:hypothetical protein
VEASTLQLRRYRCRSCGAVVTVAPHGLLPRMLYSGAAVALALSEWASQRIATWRLRAGVSPRRGSACEREHGWRAVARWAHSAQRWWSWLRVEPGRARDRALQIAQQLAGRALSATGLLSSLACEGALRADAHRA